jgi:RNA polymerase sigma factor (sigma-70 family)
MEFRFATQPWLHGICRKNQIEDEISTIVRRCLARIRLWRVPHNWSFQDWFDEIEELATAAAWLAASDCRQSTESSFSFFLQQRILSTVRTRYRQEFLYGLRFAVSIPDQVADSDDRPSNFSRSSYREPVIEPLMFGDLAAALEKLSTDQRFVIEQLFWHERTQTELALSLGLSQRGVSKRMQSALRALRALLEEK